jgi:hypothetical protein
MHVCMDRDPCAIALGATGTAGAQAGGINERAVLCMSYNVMDFLSQPS